MKLIDLMHAPPRDYMPEEYKLALAKRWAKAHGYHGVVGGWIYPRHGRHAVTQGWHNFWDLKRRDILDDLTREYTVFLSFAHLTGMRSYTPTLRATTLKQWPIDALADAYDHQMKLQRDPRRAERGRSASPSAAEVERLTGLRSRWGGARVEALRR